MKFTKTESLMLYAFGEENMGNTAGNLFGAGILADEELTKKPLFKLAERLLRANVSPEEYSKSFRAARQDAAFLLREQIGYYSINEERYKRVTISDLGTDVLICHYLEDDLEKTIKRLQCLQDVVTDPGVSDQIQFRIEQMKKVVGKDFEKFIDIRLNIGESALLLIKVMEDCK